MKTQLLTSKNSFKKEVEEYIASGRLIVDKSQVTNISKSDFEKLEKEFDFWKDEVRELLKQRFNNPKNEYYNDFKNAGEFHSESISEVMRGANPNDIQFRYRYFKDDAEPKVESLISLLNKLKFIPETDIKISEDSNPEDMTNPKIFISHSSLDSEIVEKIIDILEAVGVSNKRIFCSSFEGYGVKLGADFLDVIKNELNNQVLVIFVLSSNFYSSTVSICEMGATWVKTNQHIPILIPPFNYKDIKGVIPTTHGMKINEKEKYNLLKEVVEQFLNLEPVTFNVWERKRDKILKEVKVILDRKPNNKVATIVKEIIVDTNSTNHPDIDETNAKIIEQSKKEWPDDYEMQLDYIERQKAAVESLKLYIPTDIPKHKFKEIRNNAQKEWPNDFEMQLDFEQQQVQSCRVLKLL